MRLTIIEEDQMNIEINKAQSPTACISHCWQRVCVGYHSWLPCGNSTTKRFESRNGSYTRTLYASQKYILPKMNFIVIIYGLIRC